MQLDKQKVAMAMLNANIDTFKHLSNVTGVSVNTLSRMNNGAEPTIATVRKLAAGLGVQVAEIIKREE